MSKKESMYCFRASWKLSTNFDPQNLPDWLSLDTDWQGYKISTLPWIASVARVVGALEIEDTPAEWISYLESLGLREIKQVSCEEMFEDKGYS